MKQIYMHSLTFWEGVKADRYTFRHGLQRWTDSEGRLVRVHDALPQDGVFFDEHPEVQTLKQRKDY